MKSTYFSGFRNSKWHFLRWFSCIKSINLQFHESDKTRSFSSLIRSRITTRIWIFETWSPKIFIFCTFFTKKSENGHITLKKQDSAHCLKTLTNMVVLLFRENVVISAIFNIFSKAFSPWRLLNLWKRINYSIFEISMLWRRFGW